MSSMPLIRCPSVIVWSLLSFGHVPSVEFADLVLRFSTTIKSIMAKTQNNNQDVGSNKSDTNHLEARQAGKVLQAGSAQPCLKTTVKRSRNRGRTYEAEAARTFAVLSEKASRVQLISSLSQEHSEKESEVIKVSEQQDLAAQDKAKRIIATLTTKAAQVELLSLLSQELEDVEQISFEEPASDPALNKKNDHRTSFTNKLRLNQTSSTRKKSENRKVGLRTHPSVVKINQLHVRVDSPLSLEDILSHLQEAICTSP